MRRNWAGSIARSCVLGFAVVASQWGCSSEPPPADPSGSQPAAAETSAASEAASEPVLLQVPLGLPGLPVPDDNPMTAAKVELGRMLYFDTRLSKDGTVSCATCHDPRTAWTEHRAASEGIKGQIGTRNAPSVINSAYATAQFWDGRAKTLEEQALGPIANPIEMGHQLDVMVADLSNVPAYAAKFQTVFGTGITQEGVGQAIAAFERTVLSGNSPYDRFENGETSALDDAQKRGLKVFQQAGCQGCHAPPVFSNFRYYNAGVGMDQPKPDEGRKTVTGDESDLGKFRVPALREVANTGPYFHDGSVATLEEAVAVMAQGGLDNPNLSEMLKKVGAKNLSEADRNDLVAFLKALSGEFPVISAPEVKPEVPAGKS